MKYFLLIYLFFLSINLEAIIYPITPKYASLKKEKTFARFNASFDADVKFIYKKKNLPVLIINEKDNWRKIVDIDNQWGWVHISMISNKKTFINQKKQNLLKYKDNSEIITAIVNDRVIGKIIRCEEKFCKVKINYFKGWIEKKYLWGIKKN
tara:strand:+ start:37243 stop:37698 length:456 start_codon:yes stop_codon:yes gene_type:complete